MLKRLISYLGSRDEPPGPGVHTAIFGKHPGWADHMEEIGFDSELLVAFRRMFYTDGIVRIVGSGTWSELTDDERLDGFGHQLLWCRPTECIVGRLWSSSDGRGRSSYPMVAVVHAHRYPLAATLAAVWPALADAETAFRAAPDMAGVRAEYDRLHARIVGSLRGLESAEFLPMTGGTDAALRQIVAAPEFGAEPERMERVLYQLHREMGTLATRTGAPRSSEGKLRCAHLRVPRAALDDGVAARQWVALVWAELGEPAPLLVFLPAGRDWLDVIVGPPTTVQLSALRISTRRMPLTTEIPYTVDDRWRARIEAARSAASHGSAAAEKA